MSCRAIRRGLRRLGAFAVLGGLSAAIILSHMATGDLTAMADPPTSQEKCEWQAQRSFLQIKDAADADDEFHERDAAVSMDYHPHYNAVVGRCLMLIEMSETSPSELSHTVYIVDAGEPSHEYAFFREIGGTPIVCELRPSRDKVRFCASRESFDAFVARYMDE